MKSRVAILIAALAAVFTATILIPSASAQRARVQVPFEFAANHQVLPAGSYRIELSSDTYLMLVDCATGKVVGLMVRAYIADKPVQTGKLVFRVTDSGYRLTQISFPYINIHSDLAVQPSRGDFVAKNKAEKNVEIAMR